MVLKGKVSSIESSGIRVLFPERDNDVSWPLKAASHVGTLQVGDNVAVVFFSNSMNDGLIIAKF
ncbi:hypothetical protein [Calorimonas adulescens]|uniref:Uncharacterized protein n=1 Tax=Calorimonas adulescens TaxID=2606906 RepID=A0A5D8QBA2_9THEO|nr:hypothetical protein [Calorimonas adulescens]TZE82005.1 hypothetical protein FWJ32_07170 [Calorimonas adulescens]